MLGYPAGHRHHRGQLRHRRPTDRPEPIAWLAPTALGIPLIELWRRGLLTTHTAWSPQGTPVPA